MGVMCTCFVNNDEGAGTEVPAHKGRPTQGTAEEWGLEHFLFSLRLVCDVRNDICVFLLPVLDVWLAVYGIGLLVSLEYYFHAAMILLRQSARMGR